MKRARQPATLKDIAQATGYSINTISRALRDKDDIAQATKQKIKEVAAQMGHINNTIASSLRLGYTNTIAVILGDISNPHFGIMMKDIENRARTHGYTSFLLNTNENEEMERQAIQSALNKNVDGIIICPVQQSEKNIRYLMDLNIPFVQIGRYFPDLDANYVICNDELGGYQATSFLLRNGHRNILMFTGPSYISSARERTAGYRRAYEEFGLPVPEGYIREVPVTTGGCEDVLRGVLEEKLPFTAICGFSDIIIWDAWAHLQEYGYEIPRDCSLIGFDNIQSRLAIPFPLSTISSFKTMMSTTSVDRLMDLIKHPQKDDADRETKIHEVIDTRLVEGCTVAPPRELK